MVALLGTVIATGVLRWLEVLPPARKAWGWCGVLLPFFVPSLMTGYCYRDTSMALVHYPWLREFLYGLIVTMQVVPVAVVILAFSPTPTTSAAALHTGRLFKLKPTQQWRLSVSSRFQYHIAAYCLSFLLAFQEADLAALMQASGWTEWMFTKHAAGLMLRETMRLTLWPVLIQLPFLIPVLIWLEKDSNKNTNAILRSSRLPKWMNWAALFWISSSIFVVALIPALQLVQGIRIGIGSLLQQPSVPREIGDALLIAATTTAGAVGLTTAFRWVAVRKRGRWGILIVLFCLLLPGLLGNLALGLIIARFFQTAPLQFAYDTPLPLILGEVGVILPKTMILFHCISRMSVPASKHFISLLSRAAGRQQRASAAELQWQTTGRVWFAVVAIVGFWAYFEVMLPSILAMPGLAPVGLVLYNNLHYGRIAALGAKLTLALLIPFIVASLFLLLRRFLSRFSTV